VFCPLTLFIPIILKACPNRFLVQCCSVGNSTQVDRVVDVDDVDRFVNEYIQLEQGEVEQLLDATDVAGETGRDWFSIETPSLRRSLTARISSPTLNSL
jgi:hypothetical protein